MAKNKDKRYLNAEEMADDLDSFLNNKRIKAMNGYGINRVRYKISHYQKAISTVFIAIFFIVSTYLLYFVLNPIFNKKSIELAPISIEEKITAELEKNRSEKTYMDYITYFEKEGYKEISIQKCDEAIEKFKNNQISFVFQKKKAKILFDMENFKESYKTYSALKEENITLIEKFQIAKSLFELKDYEKSIQILEILYKNLEKEEIINAKFEILFFLGASFFKKFLETMPKYKYLENVGNINTEDKFLEKSLSFLINLENIFQEKNKL